MTAAAPSPELLAQLSRRFGNSPRFRRWREIHAGPDHRTDGLGGAGGLAPVRDDRVEMGTPGDRVGHDNRGPLRAHEDADAELHTAGAPRAVLDAPANGRGCPARCDGRGLDGGLVGGAVLGWDALPAGIEGRVPSLQRRAAGVPVVVGHAHESESARAPRQARVNTGVPAVCSFG